MKHPGGTYYMKRIEGGKPEKKPVERPREKIRNPRNVS